MLSERKHPIVLALAVLALMVALGWQLLSFSDSLASALDDAPVATSGNTPGSSRPSAGAQTVPAGARLAPSLTEDRKPEANAGDVRITVVARTDGRALPGTVVHYVSDSLDRRALRKLSREERTQLARDREEYNRRFGATVIADAAGAVRIAACSWAHLVGRRAGLFGQLVIRAGAPEPPDGWRLVLETDTTLLVQVIAHDGKPAPDVAVALQSCWNEQVNRLADDAVVVARTDAEGTAVIKHVQLHHELFVRDGSRPPRLRVLPAIPGGTFGGIAFDPLQPPAEPVRLRLPVTGRIEVFVSRAGGVAIPGTHETRLDLAAIEPVPDWQYAAPTPRELLWQGRSDGRGRTVFAHAVCGRRFTARTRVLGAVVAKLFAGPSHADQTVRVDLSLALETVILFGRLFTQHARPVADRMLRATVHSTTVRGTTRVKTDKDGSFSLVLGKSDRGVRLHSCRFELDAPGGPVHSATLPSDLDLHPGRNDLGDIALRPTPLLVAGRFLEQGQLPKQPVPMAIERRAAVDAGDSDGWRSDPNVSVRSSRPGVFAVYAAIQPGDYRLRVHSQAHLAVPPVEFTPGVRGLEIPLRRGGSLQATVIRDPEIPVEAMRLRLVARDPGATSTRPALGNMFDPSLGQLVRRESAKAIFGWSAIEPGTYDLLVGALGTREPLTVISAIAIGAPGPSRDPRLAAIDLRGRLERIVLEVVGSDGTRIAPPDRRAFVFVEHEAEQDLDVVLVTNGVATLTKKPTTTLNVIVAAAGYASERIEGLIANRRVVLRALAPVRLRLAEDVMRGLPGGVIVRVGLRALHRDRRVCEFLGRRRRVDWMIGSGRSAVRATATGDVSIRVSRAGRYAVDVRLAKGHGETPSISVAPREIEVAPASTDAVIELAVPAAAWRAAASSLASGRRR